MALITRVSRLFRADLHAVLDRIEEPEALLRQAVREMEEDLAADEQRLRLFQNERAQLGARQTDMERSLDEMEAELDVCFESGKDDLARGLIKRKLEAERMQKVLSRKHEALEETLVALKNRVDENRARLDAMRQKAELLAEDETPAYAPDPWGTPDLSVRDEDVEVAFLREKHRRERS